MTALMSIRQRLPSGREMRSPLDAITGTPLDVAKPLSDYVSDFQERLDPVHKMVRENSIRAGEQMKTRYDRGPKGFNDATLAWLHNPLRKKGNSEKLETLRPLGRPIHSHNEDQ